MSADSHSTEQSLTSAIAYGIGWMVSARWAVRGLGFVSTLILARLLLPADFGLAAMAIIAVGLTQSIFSLGVDAALIQNPRATEADFNTAWTISLIQNTFVAALLTLLAPLAARYYGEPQVVVVIRVLAVGVCVQSFANIGIVQFRKNLAFHQEFLFLMAGKLTSFVPTVVLAIWLRNYWALILGTICGNVGTVILSYIMHPYRPRLNLSRLKQIWHFSQWLLISNVGIYAYSRADQLVVAKSTTVDELGLYAISSEFAELPILELTSPMSRVVMPGYAKVKHDPKALKHAFLKVLSATVTVALPASLGLFFVADLVVSIALGPKWLGASLLLQWLAISAGLRAASGTAGNLLVVIGQPKVAAIITWIEVVILVVATAVASTQSGLLGVAIAKTFVSLLSLFLYFSPVVRLRVTSMSEIASMFYRPFIAAVVMAISLAALSAATSTWPSIASLATKVIVGMAVYFVILMGIWRSLGRPPGVETELVRAIDHVRGLRKRSNA